MCRCAHCVHQIQKLGVKCYYSQLLLFSLYLLYTAVKDYERLCQSGFSFSDIFNPVPLTRTIITQLVLFYSVPFDWFEYLSNKLASCDQVELGTLLFFKHL